MNVIRRFGIILGMLLMFLQCGGSIPEMHYYLIDYPVPPKKNKSEPLHPVVLGIERFEATALYKEERLVYRDSPYEGKYYHYHRWITSPEEMITEKVIEQLSASSLFEQVVAFPKFSQVDYVLQGVIKAIEEWDEGDDWYARLQISFTLVPRTKDQVLWQKTIEKKNKTPHKSPAEVVRSINVSAQQCITELEQELNTFFTR